MKCYVRFLMLWEISNVSCVLVCWEMYSFLMAKSFLMNSHCSVLLCWALFSFLLLCICVVLLCFMLLFLLCWALFSYLLIIIPKEKNNLVDSIITLLCWAFVLLCWVWCLFCCASCFCFYFCFSDYLFKLQWHLTLEVM